MTLGQFLWDIAGFAVGSAIGAAILVKVCLPLLDRWMR